MNKQRNEKKKEFLDSLELNKQILNKLEDQIDRIQSDIKHSEKESTIFEKCYSYQDIEREEEID